MTHTAAEWTELRQTRREKKTNEKKKELAVIKGNVQCVCMR